jgi:hypothetical protein
LLFKRYNENQRCKMRILSKISRSLFLACFMQMAVSSVQAAWSPPVPVSAVGQDASSIDGPVLSVNSQNNAVAVWSQPPGLFADIRAASYTFGSGWGSPVIISSTALNQFGKPIYVGQGDPIVAMNNLGYAVAVWEGSEFLVNEQVNVEGVFSATRASNGTWSGVQRISALNLGDLQFDPENPVCAVNDSGLAVVVWRETRTDARYIMGSFLQQGGAWTTPVQLEGPIEGFREDTPDVAIDPNGNVVATWKRDSGTGGDTVVAVTYNAFTNSWSPPQILDPVAESVDLPKTGIDDNGNAIVVWNRTNGSQSEVISAYFTYGTGWGPLVPIFQTMATVDESFVVMDHAGNATAVWNSTASGAFQVYSSHLPLGGSWSAGEIISTNGTENFTSEVLYQRVLSVDAQGTVLVIFTNNDNLLQSAARFLNSGWQSPENITINQNSATNIGGGSCGFAISLWLGDLQGNQVVQSSVNFELFPSPIDFTGKRVKSESGCRVKTCKKGFNLLRWSPLSCVKHYLLYKGDTLIATIPGNRTSYFYKDCIKGKRCTEYTLIAVSIFDVESTPVTIKVC